MPHVIRWNIPEVGHLYHDLAISAGWAGHGETAEQAAETLAEGFTDLVSAASMPHTLTNALEVQLNDEMRDTLAEEATQQWTGRFNPRTMDMNSFRQLYGDAT